MIDRAPTRLRRDKLFGWRCPSGAKYVGRPSRWGNPFKIGEHAADNAQAVAMFRDYLAQHPELVETARRELKGFDLACWCKHEEPCHADVWLEVVNR